MQRKRQERTVKFIFTCVWSDCFRSSVEYNIIRGSDPPIRIQPVEFGPINVCSQERKEILARFVRVDDSLYARPLELAKKKKGFCKKNSKSIQLRYHTSPQWVRTWQRTTQEQSRFIRKIYWFKCNSFYRDAVKKKLKTATWQIKTSPHTDLWWESFSIQEDWQVRLLRSTPRMRQWNVMNFVFVTLKDLLRSWELSKSTLVLLHFYPQLIQASSSKPCQMLPCMPRTVN